MDSKCWECEGGEEAAGAAVAEHDRRILRIGDGEQVRLRALLAHLGLERIRIWKHGKDRSQEENMALE